MHLTFSDNSGGVGGKKKKRFFLNPPTPTSAMCKIFAIYMGYTKKNYPFFPPPPLLNLQDDLSFSVEDGNHREKYWGLGWFFDRKTSPNYTLTRLYILDIKSSKDS